MQIWRTHRKDTVTDGQWTLPLQQEDFGVFMIKDESTYDASSPKAQDETRHQPEPAHHHTGTPSFTLGQHHTRNFAQVDPHTSVRNVRVSISVATAANERHFRTVLLL